jgi:GntR family transcriptional regulator, sialic acid-inducible nan operon repressor
MSAVSSPIQRRKLYEDVAARIEDMIHEGRFAPGDRLPSEKEIMKELGVGRSTVREAMLSLRKMGLVTVWSGERARDHADGQCADQRALRRGEAAACARGRHPAVPRGAHVLRGRLARLAAERATDEDIRNLRSALEENRNMVGDHEVSGAPPSTTPSLPFRKTRSSSLCTTRSPNG